MSNPKKECLGSRPLEHVRKQKDTADYLASY